jgi:hypothetical protein
MNHHSLVQGYLREQGWKLPVPAETLPTTGKRRVRKHLRPSPMPAALRRRWVPVWEAVDPDQHPQGKTFDIVCFLPVSEALATPIMGEA